MLFILMLYICLYMPHWIIHYIYIFRNQYKYINDGNMEVCVLCEGDLST